MLKNATRDFDHFDHFDHLFNKISKLSGGQKVVKIN